MIKEFVEKYTNTFVEYHSYDPLAKNQCVDLANKWLVEIGLEAIIGTNAIDFPGKAVARGMIWIPNTPDGIPQPGDLIVYAGTIGHIDIALEGCTTSKIVAFSQNYPTGSPCVVRTGTYLRPKVVGWIHPKEIMQPDEIAVKKTDFERLVSKSSALDDILARYQVADAQGIYNMVSGKDSRITDLTKQLGTAQAEVTNKLEIIKQKDETIANLNLDNQTLIERLEVAAENCIQLGKDKGNLAIEVEQLKIQVETLKQQVAEGKITLTVADLFRLIWNQKITISKG